MAKREYIEKNRQWLADKAQEAGVKPLPKGIYYKVIASGDKDGRKPSARSVVTAHYTGRTINGRTFDSSRGGSPLAARLSDLTPEKTFIYLFISSSALLLFMT